MRLFPLRACPSCHCDSVPSRGAADLRKERPFVCPKCGEQVYARARVLQLLFITLGVGLIPLVGLYAYVFISAYAAIGLAAAVVLALLILPDRLWPLGVLGKVSPRRSDIAG